MAIKCCHISDTHDTFQDISVLVPNDIDIVFITGDVTYHGKPTELERLKEQLKKIVAKTSHVVMIVGNHEKGCEANEILWIECMKEIGVKLLMHETIEIEGYSIFGSPWTPYFGGWAYNYHRIRGKEMWNSIPENTEILLTHGPMYGILDLCDNGHVGCVDLFNKINNELPNLKYHMFGHIHETHGIEQYKNVICINSSIMNGDYRFINKPHFFELKIK
jgi:Icc-related predicted phosphoesterase